MIRASAETWNQSSCIITTMTEPAGAATHGKDYADRLVRLQDVRWKRWLDVQAVFRWNLRRLNPGVTLDVGCGIGRNLQHLPDGSVGIDVNEFCVRAANERGMTAFTPAALRASAAGARSFDTLLLAHVVEHMTEPQAVDVIGEYLPYLKADGRLILITPQEAGFRSDRTHVQLMDFARLKRIATTLGFRPEQSYSYPFPRWAGPVFTYNEFVVAARRSPDVQPRS
jgi:2-polyprenyl-3-methyl-5-hydroxy-6-metoxy-1,4-benzoquinol methylase